jgi:hypothetical protein
MDIHYLHFIQATIALGIGSIQGNIGIIAFCNHRVAGSDMLEQCKLLRIGRIGKSINIHSALRAQEQGIAIREYGFCTKTQI